MGVAGREIHGVLLDLDGTLIDSFRPITLALNKTLAEFGLPQMTDKEVRRHTGRGECSMVSLFGDRREEASARYLEYHDEHLLDIRPMPGAADLVSWLSERRIASGIVTSKEQLRAERQLRHFGWKDKVGTIVGMSKGRRQKPDPHTLQLACEALDISPQSCVMIGDGTADMQAAKSAGALPLGLTHCFSAQELTEAGAKRCFSSLFQAHAWLQRLMA